ncbi:hypothetical protein IM538_03985 [Cytobacillus suaedae]|nr:hypothetical protein IM538_03985 [Cytobacillus suaedae]
MKILNHLLLITMLLFLTSCNETSETPNLIGTISSIDEINNEIVVEGDEGKIIVVIKQSTKIAKSLELTEGQRIQVWYKEGYLVEDTDPQRAVAGNIKPY